MKSIHINKIESAALRQQKHICYTIKKCGHKATDSTNNYGFYTEEQAYKHVFHIFERTLLRYATVFKIDI